MHRWPLNRHAGWDVWPAFDRGRWIDFNPTVVVWPDGRTIAVIRRDACPPVPGKGTLWWLPVDAQLRPAGVPKLLVARGEDPRAIMLGSRMLLFYCVIDRDAEDRVSGSTMLLAEFEIEGGEPQLKAHFQLPKNPVGLAKPGDRAADWEKNWVPFAVSATEVALLYAHDPWHVLVLDCNPATPARRFARHHAGPALKWRYGQVRGGTPPLPFGDDQLITFFHSSAVLGSRKVYFVGACVFDQAAPYTPRKMTMEPLLAAPYRSGAHRFGWRFAGSVVFPLGAQREADGYRLLCGLDDGEIGSFLIDDAALAERLERLDAAPVWSVSDGDDQRLQGSGPWLLSGPEPVSEAAWPLARLLDMLCGRGRTAVVVNPGDGVAVLMLAPSFDRVVACEPSASRRARLQRNLALNGLERVALQASDGLQPTLDEAEHGGVDLLCVDAPAQVLAVLDGAERTVLRDRPALLLCITEEASSGERVQAWLDARGYSGQRLAARHPDWLLALPDERRAAWAWWF